MHSDPTIPGILRAHSGKPRRRLAFLPGSPGVRGAHGRKLGGRGCSGRETTDRKGLQMGGAESVLELLLWGGGTPHRVDILRGGYRMARV